MLLFQSALLIHGGEGDRHLIRGWARMGVGPAGCQAGDYAQGIQAN